MKYVEYENLMKLMPRHSESMADVSEFKTLPQVRMGMEI